MNSKNKDKKPTDNLERIKELTEKLSSIAVDLEFSDVVNQLKHLVQEGSKIVNSRKTAVNKVKCYEDMYFQLADIIQNIYIKENG